LAEREKARTGVGFGLAGALLFSAAACGSSDSSSSSDGGGSGSTSEDATVWKVCSDMPYEPFEMEGEGPRGLKYTGFDIELLDAIAEDQNATLDITDSDFDTIFASVDYLTPNESELRILLGLPADDPRSSRELARELRRRGVRNVVVTLGRSGALILTDELDVMVPAVPVEVTDTTGAGDAFNSGFAIALAEGRDIVEAVRFGVVCGAIACTRLGVIPGVPQRAQADALYAEAMKTVWKEHP